MNKKAFWIVTAIICLAAASRLIPHPPNFTPLLAISLFAGAYLQDKRLAFLIPLTAIIASDIVLGFHRTMPFVYLAFAVIIALGFWIQKKENTSRILVATLGSSLFFYLWTNFGVWLFGHGTTAYAKNFAGLIECYVAAIPFFRSQLLGNCLYVLAFFGGFALLKRSLPSLKPALN